MSKRADTSIPKGEALRQHVLDAAERLLGSGHAGFSMRELAAAAGVSFATPFNQFGGKGAIMQALSLRRIATMIERFRHAELSARAAERVRLATRIAAAVMLEQPTVNRAVMASVGAPGSGGGILPHSVELWSAALGGGEGSATAETGQEELARQLAFGFRGVLSFWTAGEIDNAALEPAAQAIAATLMRGDASRLPDAAGPEKSGAARERTAP